VQRQSAQIITAEGKHVEGIESFVVVLAGMQGVEVGVAVYVQHHGLAIDDEMPLPVLQCRFHDPGIALGPVIAALGDEPYALVLPGPFLVGAATLALNDPAPGRMPGR
jgi:hypothetical protein